MLFSPTAHAFKSPRDQAGIGRAAMQFASLPGPEIEKAYRFHPDYSFAAATLSRKPSGNGVAFNFVPSGFRVTQQTTNLPVAIGVLCSPSRRLNSIR